ncbi:hypothetical protein SADUNF_Sadunf14G0124400 [Salix dunnii]|uniref:F-box associated beta-propeller type 3 domain-containing protein n=1 Tax=Salix dunnii TaxID=1413687 RepID=A0A835JHV1_9ROSI|nr:hypothetical protein SADUNF_Sadunf14G0124400 [Salix dunnii]
MPEPEQSLQQQQVSIVQVLTHGSPTWRSIGEELPVQLNPRQSQVLVDGRLHWLSLRCRYQVVRNLVSFDLAEEPFREVPQPAGCDNFCRRQSHLVNIGGGCLSAVVYHGCLRLEIWILKEYGVKKSWKKESNVRIYSPRGLQQDVDPSFKFSKLYKNRIYARVLCLIKKSEILLEYR